MRLLIIVLNLPNPSQSKGQHVEIRLWTVGYALQSIVVGIVDAHVFHGEVTDVCILIFLLTLHHGKGPLFLQSRFVMCLFHTCGHNR